MPPGKAPLEYSRGIEKTWVYGGLRVADGQTVTCTAPSRNSAHYQRFLSLVEQANPSGEVVVITDNLSSHPSVATREWLAGHPRIQQVFIPQKACWLNLQEAGGGCSAAKPWPAMLRRRWRDRARHTGRHGPAEYPRPTLGLGPSSAASAPQTPHLHLSNLRNEALVSCA
jgi:DDE superfamily endonuclease